MFDSGNIIVKRLSLVMVVVLCNMRDIILHAVSALHIHMLVVLLV